MNVSFSDVLQIAGILIGGGLLWRLWNLAEWKGSVDAQLKANNEDHERFESLLKYRR